MNNTYRFINYTTFQRKRGASQSGTECDRERGWLTQHERTHLKYVRNCTGIIYKLHDLKCFIEFISVADRLYIYILHKIRGSSPGQLQISPPFNPFWDKVFVVKKY